VNHDTAALDFVQADDVRYIYGILGIIRLVSGPHLIVALELRSEVFSSIIVKNLNKK
jgi:hypothetical protein